MRWSAGNTIMVAPARGRQSSLPESNGRSGVTLGGFGHDVFRRQVCTNRAHSGFLICIGKIKMFSGGTKPASRAIVASSRLSWKAGRAIVSDVTAGSTARIARRCRRRGSRT
jgi:hypothetical protein